MYEDKTLTCQDCGKEFIFTTSEQEFYATKGFTNEPSRCQPCRAAKKQQRSHGESRETFTATCSECGKPAQVPFRPTGDKPVYCDQCFQKRKSSW